MKLVLTFTLLVLAITACQQPGNSGGTAVDRTAVENVQSEPLGPVDNPGSLSYSPGYMANPNQLIGGAWVSQCYSQSMAPHIPHYYPQQFYRMFYIFDSQRGHVQHMVNEYRDPLCEDNFGGPINPNVNATLVVKGHYQVIDVNPMFPNVVQVALTWRACSGSSCRPQQDPVNGIYLFQNRLAAFRQSMDGRTVLFWGANLPSYPGSPTPYMPMQDFNLNVPFFRIQAAGI